MNRQAEITFDAGCEVKLVRFRTDERLGELFTIEARIIASAKVDLRPTLGKPASITLFEGAEQVRDFHGIVVESHFVDEDSQGYHHDLVLRPWLHSLAHNRTNRVFEDLSGLDIVKKVLQSESRHVDYSRLVGNYRIRNYTTQYQESDLAFISRIMEREGIYYFFEHRRDDHVLVLCDAPQAHASAPGWERVKLRPDRVGINGGLTGSLWRWHEHVRADGERIFRLQSYDYGSTSLKKGKADGAALSPLDRQEVYDFTGDFVEDAIADDWARVRLEAVRARQRTYSGSGDAPGLHCGCRFSLDSDDAFERGSDFIVTGIGFSVDAEPFRSGVEAEPRHVDVQAAPAQTIWRSLPLTPRPKAGPETAVVVAGGADDTHVDGMGRVRVRFQWGRPEDPPERARSCWLRVSHPSAGASFGHVTLPRLDEEVIVDFLDGNPDRPIVTGRVYNSRHEHAYALPQHRTRSLYRSQTIGDSGSYEGAENAPPAGRGYNELRFDDRGGSEEVYVRAQRNRLADVLLDDETRVARDSRTRVGRDRATAVRGDDALQVETGDFTLDVSRGSATITAAERISLVVGANRIDIDARGITIQVGLNKLELDELGIRLDGLTVSSSAATTQIIKGALTTVTAEGLLSLIGKPPLIA